MSAPDPSFRLGFLVGARPPDYGSRFARWRWQRAFDASRHPAELRAGAPAEDAFAQSDAWLAVLDARAIPVCRGSRPRPLPGKVVVASGALSPPPLAHTLRELEESPCRPAEATEEPREAFPAILFRRQDFPPRRGETAQDYVLRLCGDARSRAFDPDFGALALEDPSRHDRSEVTRHLPRSTRRLLDVGCGAGQAGRKLKRDTPALEVTGIENDPDAAEAARAGLDRVLEGDAHEALSRLTAEGARFDGFLFADVLEHLDDSIGALAKARAIAAPGATLLASVPNVGHVSLVRDLLAGRFDPVPAGLADQGHLRWFTRDSLREALEEAGWTVVQIQSLTGAPAPDAEAFFSALSDWPGVDTESLATYQWVAVAVARAGP